MNKPDTFIDPLDFYKCLADDTRLKSLLLLQLNRELCVCDLMAALQQSQPKVSRHLASLRECGLVATEKRGKWVYYRISRALPAWARRALKETAQQNSAYLASCLARIEGCVSTDKCN